MTTTIPTPGHTTERTGGPAPRWARTRLLTGRQVAVAVGRGRRHEGASGSEAPTTGASGTEASSTGAALAHSSPESSPDTPPELPVGTVVVSRDDDVDKERGMATAEYAIATVAAAGFAGLLVVILRSGEVRELLLGIVRSALSL